ncbi:hypothetical protein E4U41_005723 [Claviceps citrina]|nr:hypothetical protein E4U41_005723 [Claviceps citrina]
MGLLSHAVDTVREKLSLPPARSQEQLPKLSSPRISAYRGDDDDSNSDSDSDSDSDRDSRISSTASHDSALKQIVTTHSAKRRSVAHDRQLPDLGGIMVSQEVSINVQETTSTAGILQSPDQPGAEVATLCIRADSPARQREATFVDELLSLTMQADKRAMM